MFCELGRPFKCFAPECKGLEVFCWQVQSMHVTFQRVRIHHSYGQLRLYVLSNRILFSMVPAGAISEAPAPFSLTLPKLRCFTPKPPAEMIRYRFPYGKQQHGIRMPRAFTLMIWQKSSEGRGKRKDLAARFFWKILVKLWFITWFYNRTPWQRIKGFMVEASCENNSSWQAKEKGTLGKKRAFLAANSTGKVIRRRAFAQCKETCEFKNDGFWKIICKVFYDGWKYVILCEYTILKLIDFTFVNISKCSPSQCHFRSANARKIQRCSKFFSAWYSRKNWTRPRPISHVSWRRL